MTPSFESFILPYLLCLKDGKDHKMSELTQFCANFLNLSDADREERTKRYNCHFWLVTMTKLVGEFHL